MKRISICAFSICVTVAVLTTSAWATGAPAQPGAITMKMPLGCTVEKGETVPGKPSSFAVVRPKHVWESPPVAIRITVHARDFEEPNLAVPSANKVITKTQTFYPARARWSPNQSMAIDLGVKYPAPFTAAIGGQKSSIPSMAHPKCEATYMVTCHTPP